MKEKLKDDKFVKDLLMKFLFVLIIGAVALVLLNVLSVNKDGRRQIISEGGADAAESVETAVTQEELRLKEILSTIKGVGQVNVMVTYRKEETATVFSSTSDPSGEPGQVMGVIVTAEGAGSPVVKSSIISAVSAVFDISQANVVVFEKNEEVYP